MGLLLFSVPEGTIMPSTGDSPVFKDYQSLNGQWVPISILPDVAITSEYGGLSPFGYMMQMYRNPNFNPNSEQYTAFREGSDMAAHITSAVMVAESITEVGLLIRSWYYNRQAAKRVAQYVTKEITEEAAKGGQTVIGEGMKRVSMEAAKREGSVILNNMPKFTGTADQVTSQMMTYNRQWLLQQMRSGRPIIDIGLDPARRVPSIFYQMEQNMIKNYLKLHPNAFQVIKP